MATTDLYSYCSAQLGENATANDQLMCFSEQIAMGQASGAAAAANDDNSSNDSTFRDFLLLYAAALVFFMQAGFAMLCAGCVQKKNVQNTMLKNLLDACGSSLAFYCVGYAFAFGGMDELSAAKTFIGTSNFFMMGVEDYAFWMFQFVFSAAAATIVAGTLAERCQMAAYLGYSCLLSGFVYPVVAHSIWSPQGFLSATSVQPLWGVGMIDFAGSAVVHLTGGVTALCATSVLGARQGRFHDQDTGEKLEEPKEFPGHSIALQMLGTFILWFGWFGFNTGPALLSPNMAEAGSVASLACVNTSLSGGIAGIVALVANLVFLRHTTGETIFDLQYAMNGSLCGLASITAGCAVVEPWAALVTGSVAGLMYMLGSRGLVRLCIDDAVDAIPVHMLGGIIGPVVVGLLASPSKLELAYGHADHPGWFYSFSQHGGSDGTLLGAQLVGILFVLGWVCCIMYPFFIILNVLGLFRSDPLEEIVGLDMSYHGGTFLLKSGDGNHVTPSPEDLSAFEELKRSRHGSSFGDFGLDQLDEKTHEEEEGATKTHHDEEEVVSKTNKDDKGALDGAHITDV